MKSDSRLQPAAPRSGTVTASSYEAIRESIVRGKLAAGAPLIERLLASRLQVSRATVRSALQRLEHEGLVVSAAAGKYSRSVVAPLTAGDMDELYELIAVLNGSAARRAACLSLPARRTLADGLDELNDMLARAASAVPRDFAAVYEIDERFHARYVEVGGRRLTSLYNGIIPQSERYGRMYAAAFIDEISTSVLEHAAAVQAIRAGDAEGAERAAAANWRNAAARFRTVIERLGEQGTW